MITALGSGMSRLFLSDQSDMSFLNKNLSAEQRAKLIGIYRGVITKWQK
jgi:hypothetical protein